MNQVDPIAALALPSGALVDRRIPKKLLVEHGARTAADRRHIREGIEEIRWLATLKPTTIGVAEYRDSGREYIEIAVVKLNLRPGARAERLTELVHRAVPYPVLLFSWQEEIVVISLAHKRWSQGEEGRTVLDGDVVAIPFESGCSDEFTTEFCEALAMNRQPRTTLYALYQGWIDAAYALRAAKVTGNFLIQTSPLELKERVATLQEYSRLKSRIAELSAATGKEKQIARRVDMNLELKRLRTDRDVIRARL